MVACHSGKSEGHRRAAGTQNQHQQHQQTAVFLQMDIANSKHQVSGSNNLLPRKPSKWDSSGTEDTVRAL